MRQATALLIGRGSCPWRAQRICSQADMQIADAKNARISVALIRLYNCSFLFPLAVHAHDSTPR
jgi:hypothetical protein